MSDGACLSLVGSLATAVKKTATATAQLPQHQKSQQKLKSPAKTQNPSENGASSRAAASDVDIRLTLATCSVCIVEVPARVCG